MTVEEFRDTLSSATSPSVSPPLLALWHDAKGDWEKAHLLAQDVENPRGAWVHAYCTARKATSAMPATGTAERTSRSRQTRLNRNGIASRDPF
jgi:hypothetical protein